MKDGHRALYSHHIMGPILSTDNMKDSRAVLRKAIGFYIGAVFGALPNFLVSVHVLWVDQKH